MKYLYLAYNLFDSVLKNKPMMSGCYQWIRAFNGDAKNLKDLGQEDSEILAKLEKYDVIMVNADGADCHLLSEIRSLLGWSSSTTLVLNQDYAPEIWTTAFQFPVEFKDAMMQADCVFATAPIARDLMQAMVGDKKQVTLCPHPVETHVLRKFRSTYTSDHLAVFWHRYFGGETFVPYVVAQKCYRNVSLIGYSESEDPNARRTKCTFKRIFPLMTFNDYIKVLHEAKFGFEPFRSYSFGRSTCDSAAVGLPVVGSESLFSMQVNYPMTCVDPYDVNKIRALFDRMNRDPTFYNDVKTTAQYNVDFFGHDACRERFTAMVEGYRKSAGLSSLSSLEELDRQAKRGEADRVVV